MIYKVIIVNYYTWVERETEFRPYWIFIEFNILDKRQTKYTQRKELELLNALTQLRYAL
jgi:hypothetical protein